MEIALLSFIFLFGLLIGSFLNVVAIRVLKNESISFPPSHCVKCHHRLQSRELIPVFSYMWLRGKCRYCRDSISLRYPAGELSTGLLYALAYWVIGDEKELLAALFFISILVIITQTDLEGMLIPDSVVVVGLAGALGLRMWTHPYPLWDHLAAVFVGSGILLLLGVVWGKLLNKEAMGGGDIKLYAFVGLILGIKLTLLSLFMASVIGLGAGLLRRVRNRGQEQEAFAFGPYIAVGAVLTYLWGDPFIRWYVGLI